MDRSWTTTCIVLLRAKEHGMLGHNILVRDKNLDLAFSQLDLLKDKLGLSDVLIERVDCQMY
jgi:hypothetical protein